MTGSFTFPGIGTVVNVLAIIAGGLLGSFFGRFLGDRQQDALAKASGVCVLFLGISGHSMLLILSLVLGTLIGEFLDIERHLEELGEWLKIKSGNAKDNLFIEGFLTASLTVCVGAMAIVGSIQDGILGDPSTLIAKAVLDFIIIIAMTGSRDTAVETDQSADDGPGAGQPFYGRIGHDLLRGREPGLGQENPCRQYAAGACDRGGVRIYALGTVKGINL